MVQYKLKIPGAAYDADVSDSLSISSGVLAFNDALTMFTNDFNIRGSAFLRQKSCAGTFSLMVALPSFTNLSKMCSTFLWSSSFRRTNLFPDLFWAVLIMMNTSLIPAAFELESWGLRPMAKEDLTGFVLELKSRFKISMSAWILILRWNFSNVNLPPICCLLWKEIALIWEATEDSKMFIEFFVGQFCRFSRLQIFSINILKFESLFCWQSTELYKAWTILKRKFLLRFFKNGLA